jgi:histidinol-phosphate aminotransferase
MASSRDIIRVIPELEDYASAQGIANPAYSLIDCGLGHSPFGYPAEVNNAISEITEQSLSEYNGADAYSKSLSEPVRERFNLNSDTEVFFNGAGSYGMLASILNDFVSPEAVRKGLKIIGFGPQFTNIDMLANRAGVPYQSIQPNLYDSHTSKIDALIEARRKSRKAAIVYIDNPNNPTGNANSIEEIESLAKATAKHDLLIVDEAYGDLIPDDQSAIPLAEKYDNLIVIRSLSKGIGLASPRLGYAVMSEGIAKEYKKIELVFNVDTFTAMLGRIALNPSILSEF